MPAPRLAASKRFEAMLALWQGATQPEAAARAGISPRSVYRLAVEAGGMRPAERKVREGALGPHERERVLVALASGGSMRSVAAELGRAPSTISREVAANGGRDGYSPWAAQQRADRLAARPKAGWTRERPELWVEVQVLLAKRWSPRQISRRLRSEHPDQPQWWVSHESIYQAIFVQAKGELRRELAASLRSGRAARRPQARAARTRNRIPNMVNIVERPAEAADRAVPGHWEGDLIIGRHGRSQVATLVERSTRFGFLVQLENRTAEEVARRLAEHVQTLPQHLWRSLTWDQGIEMAGHQRFSLATGIPVYFCDPHAPWMRGTNENWNGLVRQYLPKSADLSPHSQQDLDRIAAELNGRPRETLDWQTPAERLDELLR